MSEDQFDKLRDLYARASEIPLAQRSAWIIQNTEDAVELRRELFELLDQTKRADEASTLAHLKAAAAALLPDAIPTLGLGEQAPEFVGAYRVLRKLGEGGMGTVYLAKQINPEREVAVKVLRDLYSAGSARQRFELETKVHGRMRHVGIAQIIEAGVAPLRSSAGAIEVPFFAMEYIDGLPITDYATDQSLGTRERLEIIARICDAVHYAHGLGIIHRDLKPANILVDRSGQPKVLDFGVARSISEQITNQPRTLTGQIIGTLPYMSPEQVVGNSAAIDARSDVYALGVITFELLAGRRPIDLDGLALADAVFAICEIGTAQLSALDTRFRGDIDTIVSTALSKDPQRRYPSAATMAADIRRYLDHEPISARPASRIYRIRKFARRHRGLVAGGLVALSILIIGIIATTTMAVRAQRNATEAKRSREAAMIAQADAEAARDLAASESWQKSIALEAEKAALDDFERLADVRRLQEAKAAAEALWPAHPGKIADISSWLERFSRLATSLPDHEASLAAVRATALPHGDEEQRRELARASAEIRELQRSLAKYAASPTSNSLSGLVKANNRVRSRRIKEQIAELESRAGERRIWSFGDDDVKQWKHEVLSELVEDLKVFVAEDDGIYADVRRRLRTAQYLARIATEHKSLWVEAARSITNSEEYGGLVLEPQIGLLPLGRDPQSGLHEFLHLETHEGTIPNRDEAGRIPMTERTGLIFVLIPKGKTWIGSQANDAKRNYSPHRREDEVIREVIVDREFFLSKYEMTQGQWGRSPTRNKFPSFFGVGFECEGHKGVVNLLHPVENVSWITCDRVLRRMRLGLPTHEQWEYAARGGTSSQWGGESDSSEIVSRLGNFAGRESRDFFAHLKEQAYISQLIHFEDDYILHAPVGEFDPNAFGLFDTVGNVAEWTSSSTLTTPTNRIIRGGGYYQPAFRCRVSVLGYDDVHKSNATRGLRPLREVFRD